MAENLSVCADCVLANASGRCGSGCVVNTVTPTPDKDASYPGGTITIQGTVVGISEDGMLIQAQQPPLPE